MYKILLENNYFMIADKDYILNIYWKGRNKKMSIEKYMRTHIYRKWYFINKLDNTPLNFTIIEYNENLPCGMYKLSQDIKHGDFVLGVDNEPQIVTELHTGQDEMYEIDVAGETYTVNGGHILHLIDTETEEELEMPVNVFMCMGEQFHKKYKMKQIIN